MSGDSVWFGAITRKPIVKIQFNREAIFVNQSQMVEFLNLVAKIPSTIFDNNECHFEATINNDGVAEFGFLTNSDGISQDIVDDINDEFAALAESELVEGIHWNVERKKLTAETPEAVFNLITELYDYLSEHNHKMADVLLSTAASILNDYFYEEEFVSEKLSQPEAQYAIVRALKSIISTYDGVDDFTVKATENKEIDTGKTIFDFEITLGKNTPVSFEKRFKQLRYIYDAFESVEAIASRVDVEM